MKPYIFLSIFFLSLLYACKETPKEPLQEVMAIPASSASFDAILEAYYEKRLQLYPLNATSEGDSRYNDRLPNDLTDKFLEEEKTF